MLGHEPTVAHDRGTNVSGRDPNSPTRDRTVWLIESDVPHEEPLEAHLAWAITLARNMRPGLANLPPGSDVEIRIGWTPDGDQDSVYLSELLISEIAGLHAAVALTIYEMPGDDDG